MTSERTEVGELRRIIPCSLLLVLACRADPGCLPIKNSKIYFSGHREILDYGMILDRNGKIGGIGPHLYLLPNCSVLDLGEKTIIPKVSSSFFLQAYPGPEEALFAGYRNRLTEEEL